MDKTQIRHAATVILIRDRKTSPSVLMGQRGAKAAFMPNKFVFPGGAMDEADKDVPLASGMAAPCADRMAIDADPKIAKALAVTAIRELWEETGLALGEPCPWDNAPEAWSGFTRKGLVPTARALSFVFRAVTPPGRPRRFDARFLSADAKAIAGDPDDFSAASDELSHLQWIPLTEVRSFDLPFITKVVLAEIAHDLAGGHPPAAVPYFNYIGEASKVSHIGEL